MVQGLANKVLRVDLSDGRIWTEQPDERFYRRYLGGAGFVGYYLLKEVPAGTDPLAPENRLVFAAGPITGTPMPGGSRLCVGAKSPLSGGIAKCEAGGHFGYELKRAGFDALVVQGRAARPVYLWIQDGEAQLKDAGALWGRTVLETHEAVEGELGERRVRTAAIGPAGERLAAISCVMTDVRNAAGRGGLGAVMGSKNLKCVAVKGSTIPQAADRERYRELARWMNNNYQTLGNAAAFHALGTGAGMVGGHAIGNLPVRNWSDGSFDGVEQITADAVRDSCRVAMDGCPGCQIRCKKVVELENERFRVDRRNGGPEYETLASFGSFMGIADLAAICRANELCSLYSLDTISTGGTIAFAMECFERGILTAADTGGIELRFGNAEAMLRTIELIARREGLGDLLADGSRAAARRLGRGAQALAMQVKGVEFGMHEPRLKQGLGLVYAIAANGADHMAGAHDTSFMHEGRAMEAVRSLDSPAPLPASDLGAEKVDRVRNQHLWRNFSDSMVMCHFVPWTLRQQVDLLRAQTGWDYTDFEAVRQGERVATMARVFNLREGLTAADDCLPARFHAPTPRGALQHTAIDPAAFAQAKRHFYSLMGWDPVTGVPEPVRLEALGLGWAAATT
ncbi:aldehyde ferredoxin oxidoreductase family protein [Ramlibacter sp.]|uniref:aldehyde ferredoxin oxidoreductase family protein n=1 Tax=Ramlibacter sp. TaxID=1917967 RepID=UPI002C8C3827|nr:aldehyde ferredoxin oxidoreductase family protein [Ramlibacter sp.]HWI81980.1 aldehyde ferredoxin oxidoreductase family protein [Ramlibacter sp.]